MEGILVQANNTGRFAVLSESSYSSQVKDTMNTLFRINEVNVNEVSTAVLDLLRSNALEKEDKEV